MSQIATNYVQEDCPKCFIAYFVPIAFQKAKVKDKSTMWCPNGHASNYCGETEETRLRGVIDEKNARIDTLSLELERAKKKPRTRSKKKS